MRRLGVLLVLVLLLLTASGCEPAYAQKSNLDSTAPTIVYEENAYSHPLRLPPQDLGPMISKAPYACANRIPNNINACFACADALYVAEYTNIFEWVNQRQACFLVYMKMLDCWNRGPLDPEKSPFGRPWNIYDLLGTSDTEPDARSAPPLDV